METDYPFLSPPYEGFLLVTDVSFWNDFREKETTYSRHRKQMGENIFHNFSTPKIEERRTENNKPTSLLDKS